MAIQKVVYPFIASALAFSVLFVSMSRAGAEIAAQEDMESKIRQQPIEFVVYHKDGQTEPVTYKVPEVTTLPSNPFYGFKKLRDFLWVLFSGGELEKAKVSLLLADKKISEARELIKDDNNKLALEASIEALDKLKYADKQISLTDNSKIEVKQIKKSIYQAGRAYREVIKTMEGMFEIDLEKLNEVINSIDKFNEEKAKELEKMED